MGINEKLIIDVVNKIIKALKSGEKLNFDDPNEVGQFVMSTLAMCAELVPWVGPIISSLVTLVGEAMFPANAIEHIWDSLRERIEKLIDSKIQQQHIKVLTARIDGFQTVMQTYKDRCNYYDTATGPDKVKAAEAVRITHTAFLLLIEQDIPQFRIEPYEVASLPLFALVATMHLVMLSDGMKSGRKWGYDEGTISSMGEKFKALTSPGMTVMADSKSGPQLGLSLKEAIQKGRELGLPAQILDIWQTAYANLGKSEAIPGDSGRNLDYASYAKKFYKEGREKVKPYKPQLPESSNRGITDAAEYRAYADYDSSMIIHVLNYVELWPFLAGKKVTEEALKNVDREIFCGPFGRYTKYAKWSPSNPPPVEPRGARITAVKVWAWDAHRDVDGLQIKYGESWGPMYGTSSEGGPKQLPLLHDEYVYDVGVYYGHKLGTVKFRTNKKNLMQHGPGAHASFWAYGHRAGYELTSVYITNWESHPPSGCEGIILGFRPLVTDPSRN